MNATTLRGINKALVIQDNDKPLAVLLTYEQFLNMQRGYETACETVQILVEGNMVDTIRAGLRDLQLDKTRKLLEIRKSLERTREEEK